MNLKLYAVLIALAVGIIILQCGILYYSATHDHRQTAIIEEAVTNVIFPPELYEGETH